MCIITCRGGVVRPHRYVGWPRWKVGGGRGGVGGEEGGVAGVVGGEGGTGARVLLRSPSNPL